MALNVEGDGFEPVVVDAERPGLVVLRVSLAHVALAGGGVLPGDLDDGLLDGHRLGEEVNVPGTQSDELTPAHTGLDGGLDQQPVAVRDRGDECLVLGGG